ncbi:MAG: hypothetical protein GX111_10510 [Clostridiales bacterium]|nr:hypothetical protein [Clostridiales bacterium]
MKRTFALILAIVIAVALLNGCGQKTGGNAEVTNTAAAEQTPAQGTPEQSTPEPDPESPYNFAVGKYETGPDGWATGLYSYELPLATTDETFSYYVLNFTPQYIPDNDMQAVPYVQEKAVMTGVNIEYILCTMENVSTMFSVMMASDDIPDIVSMGNNRIGMSMEEAINENWYCNIYDYKEYMPNYFYLVQEYAKESPSLLRNTFIHDDMVGMIWTFINVAPEEGWYLRQDWMDELNLGKAGDVTTIDELYDVLTAFKAAYGDNEHWPMTVFAWFELSPGRLFSGYNTSLWNIIIGYYKRVNEGKVEFCGATDDDLAAMTRLHQWWDEGLIDPNYSSYMDSIMINSVVAQDRLGYVFGAPTSVPVWEELCVDPDCRYEPTPRLRLYEDQELQWNLGKAVTFSMWTISAKCANLPLVLSWTDWHYSTEGSDFCTWGLEGSTWEYDDAGERMLTEFVLEHPAGPSSILSIYAGGDVGVFDLRRNFAYDGGERFYAMYNVWDVSEYYGGKLDFPADFTLSAEAGNEVTALSGDLSTYYAENYNAFFDGSRPLSEWDDYIASLMEMGLERVYEIYQSELDVYYSAQ